MAVLSHFSTFPSHSSLNLSSSPLPSLTFHLHCRPPQFSSPSHHFLEIHASSASKPRGRRKVKSNAELCNEITEFLSGAGLPEDHVPTMKELKHHGRQELANIIRRRGYKLIRELLSTSGTKVEKSYREEDLTKEPEPLFDSKDESAGQNVKVEGLDDYPSLSSGPAIVEDYELDPKSDSLLSSEDQINRTPESSMYSSLQEKVAKFIQNGELDTVEDDSFEILSERVSPEADGLIESKSVLEPETDSNHDKRDDLVLSGTIGFDTLNGNVMSLDTEVDHLMLQNNVSRKDYLAEERTRNDETEDHDIETQKIENQAEINRLKFILHQKELELSQLKQRIQKEKLALAQLQSIAEMETSKAQKLLSEKDAELHAAEESLSGLTEVEIEYWGDGQTVEVAGSFNGWHDKIKMDPEPSLSTKEFNGSRKSQLWKSALWLYPGIYEVKFIVDGHWTIDPQRESVTKGTIQNNILRVDR